ncbi:MAG: DUF2149 domain-containing protein [Coriobacteriia bacterium]|nr:DUF2149 domain-containing protein [Coriobacteriia bacterium]
MGLDDRRRLSGGSGGTFMRHRRLSHPIHQEDPMSMMGNLFDIALLIGIGLLIMALSSFGLNDLLTNADTTIVKNPGTPNMEIVTRKGGKITRLKQTGVQTEGPGTAVGTVYRLQSGEMIWVPSGPTQ